MNFRFIGHCYDPLNNHDKVWGVINLDSAYGGKVLTFWGRRGKKLQTKQGYNNNALSKLIRDKERDGYQVVDEFRLNDVYPEFQADLEKTAMWAMLMA
jgi:predicted DNA-binding WGR domain protein